MKKIVLLLVAAVFVIGMQSCSTDDKTNFAGDQIPENAIKMTRNGEQKGLGTISPCFKKIFVVYRSGSNDQDNLDYVSTSLKFKYSTIWSVNTPYCTNIYEWYVPCDELPEYICNTKCKKVFSPKTTGKVVHTPEPATLGSEETEDDPACGECPKNYGWVSNNTPSCKEIKTSLGWM